jgi:UDP-glucose 4-epimerase
MKILVTGGAGFLGSHVADALSQRGHDVTVFDLRESPYLKTNQRMITGDILDRKHLEKAVADHEIVYHFAGIADIDECARRPVETVEYNIMGTALLLDVCRRAAVERFVFASSAYVYSDHGYFYRTSKRACELLLEDYFQVYGLKYTAVRYGSLYGERADSRNSIYKIIDQALTAKKITYHGTGDELREFIHVKDAAEGSVQILDTSFENQHIILTGTQTMRYKDLLEMVGEMLGKKIDIDIISSNREAHYKITPYNFSPRLGKKLVINPHIDMGQGLLLCMSEIYEKILQKKSDGER